MAQLGVLNALITHKSLGRRTTNNKNDQKAQDTRVDLSFGLSKSINNKKNDNFNSILLPKITHHFERERDQQRHNLNQDKTTRTNNDPKTQIITTHSFKSPPPQLDSRANANDGRNLNHNHNLNLNDDDNSWHLIHYHKPYAFMPQFNDYEFNLDHQSHDDQNDTGNDNRDFTTTQLMTTTNLTTNANAWNPMQILQMFHAKLLKLMLDGTAIIPTTTLHNKPLSNGHHHLAGLPITNSNSNSNFNYHHNQTEFEYKNWDHLAHLSCDSGEMIVKLNFSEPFKGIVYPDYNRLSPCRFFGDGHLNYELRLPLRGCGTRQAAPRLFINDVVVRFHKSLELEEDEVKTLICRYPPPQTPPSVGQGIPFGLEAQSDPLFEFVNNNNNANNNRLSNTNQQTQIETLSENLAVNTPPSLGPTTSGSGLNHDHGSHPDPWPMIPVVLENHLSNVNRNNNNPNYTTNNTSNPNNNNKQPQRNLALVDQVSSLNQVQQDANINSARIGQLPPAATNSAILQRSPPGQRVPPGSGLELLLLISSLMFLVLLGLAFVTSYYCLQRRRRSRLDSSRSSLAPNTSGHFVPTGYSSSHHHRQQPHSLHGHHIHQYNKQQQPQAPVVEGRAGAKSNQLLDAASYWTPASVVGRGQMEQQHYHAQWFPNPVVQIESAKVATGGRNQFRGLISTNQQQPNQVRLSRWPPEPELVEAHLRGLVAAPRRPRPPKHAISATEQVPYTLVEPRQARHVVRTPRQVAPALQEPESSDSSESIEPGAEGNQTPGQLSQPFASSNHSHDTAADHQLWRTKSWISERGLERAVPPSRARPPRALATFTQDQEADEYAIAPSLSFNNRHQKQEQFHQFYPATLNSQLPPNRVSFARSRQLDSRQSRGSGSQATSTSRSYTTLDDTVAPNSAPTTNAPRILIKSIEDSYIRKLTEIDTNDYLSRDSRQPLSLAQWRDLIAKNQHQQEHHHQRQRADSQEHIDSWRADSTAETSGSNLANLRSLSEIDISFAKSALADQPSNRQQGGHLATQAPHNRREGSQANDERDTTQTTTTTPVEEANKSVNEHCVSTDEMSDEINRKIRSADGLDSDHVAESPDLILSPEYQVDDDSYKRARKLQLRIPRQGPSQCCESPGNNSVSYV